MYSFRANKQHSQESFLIMLVDGTGSMNAHYPTFLKCFNDVFNTVRHKLAFQFGSPQKGSGSVLYNIQNFLDHSASNFNQVFKQLFDILLTQHIDKKYLTICFVSDGIEAFIFEEFLPIVKQITSVFQIQFASVAVGKQFPTQISNQFRELLHNQGNLDFPFIFGIMDLDEIAEWDQDNHGNVIMKKQYQDKMTEQFTSAFQSLKQQLVVCTGQIELNEIVYKSFLEEDQNQATKVVQRNQLFLSPNPQVATTQDEIIQCSKDIEDFDQIQKGSIQQLLIHLQANNNLEDGKQQFQKLYDISIRSQRLLIKIVEQDEENNNSLHQQQQIRVYPKINLMNNLIYQLAKTNYLASLQNKPHEYAQFQAHFEQDGNQCMKMIQQVNKNIYKPIEIIEVPQYQQQQQIKQRIKRANKINCEIKLNSKLIFLIDQVGISESVNEEIMNKIKDIFNNYKQENIMTFWWADILKQNFNRNIESQQMPLSQAILQILSIIEQEQQSANNFTICLILSGQHQADLSLFRHKLQIIEEQNKFIAFTTIIIENERQNIINSQLKLSNELRKQLHTNENHSLQVSIRINRQELHQYLPTYFKMIKEFQNKFYRVVRNRTGCFIRAFRKEKNAQFILNKFTLELQESMTQHTLEKDFIQDVKQIQKKYYQILKKYKEREQLRESFSLAKISQIFELIDKINLKNYDNLLNLLLKLIIEIHDENYKNVDQKQLKKARSIIYNKESSNLPFIGKTVVVLIGINLIITWVYKRIVQ
ncbi:unnamed protein product [Paramecium sonneborni]|uniref:Uncharacterized protein n=1 Tax=Paramecium sonneborni TaxID=65129 RepID=A0A8S1QY91_9CILI|nr:unnamed protein product [Paramecium sonneborni]